MVVRGDGGKAPGGAFALHGEGAGEVRCGTAVVVRGRSGGGRWAGERSGHAPFLAVCVVEECVGCVEREVDIEGNFWPAQMVFNNGVSSPVRTRSLQH